MDITQSIANNGNLIIKDSVGNGELTSSKTFTINNNSTGILTLESGVISANSSYAVNNLGNFVMSDGQLKSINTYALYSEKNATVNGGSIISQNGGGINQKSGKLVITDVTVQSKYNCIYYQLSTDLTISGGTFTSTNDDCLNLGLTYESNILISGGTFTGTSAITTNNFCSWYWCDTHSGTMTISGGNFIGRSYGLYVQHGKRIDITGGTISGGTYGIYNKCSQTTIVLGNDDNVLNNDKPIIIGGTYGVYNSSGIINFYDGVLKGIEAGYEGVISELAEYSVVHSDTEIIDDVEYKKVYLIPKENFLRVGGNEFNSLKSAIDSIETSGTIYVTDSTVYSNAAEIPSSKKITIDLYGNKLNTTITIVNKGELTIKDSIGDGELYNNKTVTLKNESTGTLTIESGTIYSNETYAINNSGSLVITDGVIKNTSSYVIYSEGSIDIDGGTIISESGRGINQLSGSIDISDVTIQTYYDCIYYQLSSTLTIEDGTFISTNSDALDLGLYASGNIQISGGTFTGDYAISSNNYCNWYWCDSYSGNMTISGGNFTGRISGIYLQHGKNITITGGIIKGSTYGIRNTTDQVTLTLGTKDNTLDKTKPIIIGSTYGIYSETGQINFYDGILKGTTNGYYGIINEIPDNASLYSESEIIDNTEYITSYVDEKYNFVELNGDGYSNFVSAIRDASSVSAQIIA